MSTSNTASKVLCEEDFRWQGVTEEAYKAQGTHFSGALRQVLVGPNPDEPGASFETRYFEVKPGGYTSLEHHAHAHVVVILRGQAEVILDRTVHTVSPFDCIYIHPHSVHQIIACCEQEPLGFLCIVDQCRDRPQLPDKETLDWLTKDPEVAARIRT
ncbi:cupin domain-containing protein [Halorhodospira halochloris]|uniref:Cupin type-2 domain-containing protein n=1 Tax=Halorhodospira halochloris TaxID=1052 RepID=A0A120N055_HALHR|nr:cupin domain-containing protein [Halorhodospira halochloris]MCG5529969.1 cupin domain-containing protein [Halorhodospira halochloris]MCG5548242.1 cupin domain-containing protein [Halorhodospira halochloris]BAU58823.1 hypothetical protein HH1059_21130 [Halorhodospira halochloris]